MKSLAKRLFRALGHDLVKTREASFKSVFRSKSIDLIVDVGANTGQFISTARSCGYDGPVIAFEPLREHRSLLEAMGDVSVHTSAVGANSGEIALNVYSKTDFTSVLELNNLYGEEYVSPELSEIRTVPIMTLDDAVSKCFRNIFLKIDVQGAEKHVLEGATDTLRSVDLLLIEIPFLPLYNGATSAGELFAITRDAGLYPARFWANSITSYGAWVDGDVLFVRKPESST